MKTAVLITVRLKSTRLPRKVLLDIEGKPMLVHMIDRLKLAKKPAMIILCTSTNPQDDPLAEIAKQEGIECFRGSEDDVLLRLTDAAREFGLDMIINCTADNPFVDPVYVDKLINFHQQEKNDFSRIEGLPFGVFSYAATYKGMQKVCDIKAESDTEVWGNYFTETGLFKWGALQVEDDYLRRPEIRLTVDTPEDFNFVSEIFKALYRPGEIFSLTQIIELINEQQHLIEINRHIKQKPGLAIKLK